MARRGIGGSARACAVRRGPGVRRPAGSAAPGPPLRRVLLFRDDAHGHRAHTDAMKLSRSRGYAVHTQECFLTPDPSLFSLEKHTCRYDTHSTAASQKLEKRRKETQCSSGFCFVCKVRTNPSPSTTAGRCYLTRSIARQGGPTVVVSYQEYSLTHSTQQQTLSQHTPRVHVLHWTSEGQGSDQAVGRGLEVTREQRPTPPRAPHRRADLQRERFF